MSGSALAQSFASLRGGGGSVDTDPSRSSLLAFRDRETTGRILEQEAEADGKDGKGWLVTIIRAGRSKNGLNYAPDMLREAAPLFEGIPVYAYRWGDRINHLSDEAKAGLPRGATSNLVGRVNKAWWSEEEQAIKGYVGIHDSPTRTVLKNAYSAGDIGAGVETPLLGLSIDAEGLKEGVDKSDVSRIVRANSLDLVTKPAAGGEFDRILAEQTEETMTVEEMLAALTADVKALKEQQAAAPPPAPVKEQTPLEALKAFMEGLSEEDRAKVGAQVLTMLKGMGVQASADAADKFQKLAAGVQGLMEAKDVKSMRKGLGDLLEEIVGPADDKQDEKDRRIAALESNLRKSALQRTLAPLVEEIEVDGKKHSIKDADAVVRLMSMDAVRFVEDEREGYKVEGLAEAVQALVKDKPYLLKVKEEEQPPAPKKGGAPEGDGKGKPSDDRQTFRLTEEHEEGSDTLAALEKAIMARQGRLAEGDLTAITEIRNMRMKLQAGA